jgi:hypothetical protein
MPAQVHVRFAFSNECGLALDIVQGVGDDTHVAVVLAAAKIGTDRREGVTSR